MKKFDSKESGYWDEKVNFVDENNVVLGYDMGASCCESFGWYVAEEIVCNPDLEDEPEPLWKDWVFDPAFFKEVEPVRGEHGYSVLDEGGCVAFRLVRKDGREGELFLHLFNAHNGYYGHGFEFKVGDEVVRHDSL
jgi:hypothetical protein